MTMNVSLTPHLEEMVQKKVASGAYTSASEVVREALRLLEEKDIIRAHRFAALKKDIEDGINSGESTPLDMAEIKAKARKRFQEEAL